VVGDWQGHSHWYFKHFRRTQSRNQFKPIFKSLLLDELGNVVKSSALSALLQHRYTNTDLTVKNIIEPAIRFSTRNFAAYGLRMALNAEQRTVFIDSTRQTMATVPTELTVFTWEGTGGSVTTLWDRAERLTCTAMTPRPAWLHSQYRGARITTHRGWETYTLYRYMTTAVCCSLNALKTARFVLKLLFLLLKLSSSDRCWLKCHH